MRKIAGLYDDVKKCVDCSREGSLLLALLEKGRARFASIKLSHVTDSSVTQKRTSHLRPRPKTLRTQNRFSGLSFNIMTVDILAIGVHPDDVELGSSGTLLRHAELGYSFGLLDLTRGELGSRGSGKIRTAEAYNAAEMMGAKFRENLDMADGFMVYNEDNLRKIITVIRRCQPKIVLANALDDRHPDHGRAAKLVADACFYSGLIKIETFGDDGQPQEKWRPNAVYHYIQDRNRKPDFVVDITDYLKKKMECIRCYKSQFDDHESNEYQEEVKTPISGKDFMAFIEAKGRSFGREAGYDFAEGFEVARYPGVSDLFDLK
jgi:bacillithiol biosynthesis deacetylase BshB1